MKLIELILDDEDAIGVEAISVVENPAIESDFIALSNQSIQLAEVNKEKRLLMGALLIPNKPIKIQFLRLLKCIYKMETNLIQHLNIRAN